MSHTSQTFAVSLNANSVLLHSSVLTASQTCMFKVRAHFEHEREQQIILTLVTHGDE